jgi:hypothetical protein
VGPLVESEWLVSEEDSDEGDDWASYFDILVFSNDSVQGENVIPTSNVMSLHPGAKIGGDL